MYRCGEFRKFFAVAFALGVVANAGGKPALAKARYLADAARPTAIHECNIEADKYSPITQLPNQFARHLHDQPQAAVWLVGKFCKSIAHHRHHSAR